MAGLRSRRSADRPTTAAARGDVLAAPPGVVIAEGWAWDDSLYAGSAAFYASGRLRYPDQLAGALAAELGLDGRGRLLDVGCGPGSLTLLLAPLFEAAVGIDADADMINAARRDAERVGLTSVAWYRMRAEELPAGLGRFRVVSFAQSFHWMDQPRVAAAGRQLLEPGGAWVHLAATTHEGVAGADPLSLPRPPRAGIAELVTAYLGPVRRAGQGRLLHGSASGEEDVMRAAGYQGPVRLDVGGGVEVERTEDEVVASVFSLSSAAPHLFGDRLAEFERDLRALLRKAAPQRRFAERTGAVSLVVWRL